MCKQIVICFWLLVTLPAIHAQLAQHDNYTLIDIFGDTLVLPFHPDVFVDFEGSLSEANIQEFQEKINQSSYEALITSMLAYKASHQLNDWLYYQLVRIVAQKFAPKYDNYFRYTLYKWFLMVKSGYDATLAIHNNQLLFYIWSQDEVYNIPLYILDGKQYVCLNIHDYYRATENFSATLHLVDIGDSKESIPFSYEVSRLPEFNSAQYQEKQLRFPYGNKEFNFSIQLNEQVRQIFANYPIVDFGTYFNIPVSTQTYESIVPSLKKELKNLNTKNGVDYLMKFTRNAFLYEDDQMHFGKEKRMSPEETLLARASDCDDRAALFFFLVKEIYNLPMIALLYEDHITIAVLFKKGYGKTITHNGKKYSICEPTPQEEDLPVGRISQQYRNRNFDIVYSYTPK